MISREQIIEKLRQVRDPELPVNIFDLGLIYDLSISGNDVKILMTLTTPNCPVAGEMPMMVIKKVREISDIKNLNVSLTFDPPWNKSMMSEEGAAIMMSLNIL